MEENNGKDIEITEEILRDFVKETEGLLSKAELAFLVMETKPGDKEQLNQAFRVFHTIKGTADYLGFNSLRELAHFCEEIMDLARSGRYAMDKSVTGCLIRVVDDIRTNIKMNLAAKPGINIPGFESESQKILKKISTEIIELANSSRTAEKNEAVIDFSNSAEEDSQQAIRIDAGKFNSMINSLNELVITEAIIKRDLDDAAMEDKERLERIKSKFMALDRIAAKLNYQTFTMKMLPFKHNFQRMSRLIRDLSIKSKKKIKLILNGGEIEMDREIIESLFESLVHILRNAVDHGIESPEERLKARKAEAGIISISASCREGKVIISISDDGRGLDTDRIIGKAMRTGLINKGEKVTDEKMNELILMPGFSTAEKVTELSGRGVGMDVVKKTVESLRGDIKIRSIRGQGTKITMTFPVNLAVLEGIIVECSGLAYVIPVSNIASAVFAADKNMKENGEMIDMAGYFKCGGKDETRAANGNNEKNRRIVINIEKEGINKSLLVDSIIGQQRVAVKNIPSMKLEKTCFSGAVVMPDGRPALIISPEHLTQGLTQN